MREFHGVLLKIWREACRHIEISRSVPAIADLLEPHVPLSRLAVFAVAGEARRVELVAVGGPNAIPIGDPVPVAASEKRIRELIGWCRSGAGTEPASARGAAVWRWLLPESAPGSAMARPLVSESGFTGLLLLTAADRARLSARHAAMFDLLAEPLAAALENDARLRELRTLRDAAEADKRSLLSRLGRDAIADTIVGAEGGLRGVLERVTLVARADVPVLILGETGSGKEVIARAIHEGSPRRQAPFIRVNCGAIPHELIDSQLFGHERGAFTGATESRLGWFERAHGGTLFLDEIGELPLAAQVRLLRILQDGRMERVGGQSEIRVDCRLVAATHRDLPRMVQEGNFREDLWYRISTFPLILPPLRERVGDIPELARHFARRAATRFGLPYVEPAAADLELLTSYPWPGNVRELAAVMDRAVLLGDGRSLQIAVALGRAPAPPMMPPSPEHTPAAESAVREVEPLDDAIRHHIESALAACGGQVEGAAGAAKLLGVNPHTLRARMRKLGIDWARFRAGSGGNRASSPGETGSQSRVVRVSRESCDQRTPPSPGVRVANSEPHPAGPERRRGSIGSRPRGGVAGGTAPR